MRALGWFWAALLIAAAGAAGVLQWLGPPPAPPAPPQTAEAASPSQAAGAEPPAQPAPSAEATAGANPAKAGEAGAAPPRGAIAAADPALLEPSTTYPGGVLPRIGADGRLPMRVYAAPADPAAIAGRPRVALLLSGIGLSETDSEEAIHTTPPAISLAVSPYAFRPERLLGDARASGHEVLVSLPLEPERYPIDDPGNRALLTGNRAEVNKQRLEWALTRFAGYIGATSALNGMRGERFTTAGALMQPVLRELSSRGLLYIEARPGAAVTAPTVGRAIDVVIDEPAAVRAEIEANLGRLEQVARDRGAAIGLVGMPRPVTLDRIAAWAATLGNRGIALVPVSAIALPPPPALPATARPTPAAAAAAHPKAEP